MSDFEILEKINQVREKEAKERETFEMVNPPTEEVEKTIMRLREQKKQVLFVLKEMDKKAEKTLKIFSSLRDEQADGIRLLKTIEAKILELESLEKAKK